MRRTAAIIFFCLLFSFQTAAATEYTKLKAAQAISNGSIYSLCQDGSGAVWMNTNYGLCRFNGNRLDFFYSLLPRQAISFDASGNIYVPAFDGILGISCVSGESRMLKGEGLKYSDSVVLSSAGKLFVGSANKIFFSSGCDTLIFICSLPEKERITDLKYSPGGVILASTASGNLYDVSEYGSPLCVYSAGDGISAVFSDSKKRIWLGLEKSGIRVLDSDFFPIKSYTHAGGRPIRNARTFCEDRSGTVYVGSLDGLSLVGRDGECVATQEYCPAGHAVCQVMTDRDNNVWIGTFYDGVFLCEADNSPFRAIPNPGLRLINAMVEDRSGCVWVFTDHYGLWKYTDDAGFSMVPGTLDRKFKSAWYDSRENVIWAGEYFSRLDRIDPATGRWDEFPCESGIFDIALRRGDLYLATSGGVYVFDPSSEKSVTRRIEGYSGHTNSIVFDASGTLMIAGSRLMRYAPSSGIETLPFSARCSSLSCDLDGEICASTVGKGVVLFKEGGTLTLDKAGTGIQDDYAFLVEEISDGVILVGTDVGLSLVDIQSGVCCNFNSDNGLPLSSTREGDILHRGNGDIWIGGVDGLVLLDKGRISFPSTDSRIGFEMISAGAVPLGKPGSLAGKKGVRLPSGKQSVVCVELSDFNYSGILPSNYEYRLAGSDSGWMPLDSQQKITFSELRPGRYAVEVRSCHDAAAEVSSLGIVVPRKWYATIWAIAAYVILVCGIVSAAVRGVRYRRRLEREDMERRRTMDSLVEMSGGMREPRTRSEKDSEFLHSAALVIGKHLSDEKMGVEMLCRELHLSRTMLDKKIKSLTGDSPRAFIEEIRLSRAAKLVRESDMNISEIAYETGYSSPKYFSIRFKNKYGLSPLAYRKMK